MQTNEFEKQVQQKMEELKLNPSDSVWLNIEASINKTKTRRRGWIFFSVLLLCLCCGGYFLWLPGNHLTADRQAKPLTKSINRKSTYPLPKELIDKENTPRKKDLAKNSLKDIAGNNPNKKIFAQSIKTKNRYRINILPAGFTEVAGTKSPMENGEKHISADSKSNKQPDVINGGENKGLVSNDTQDVKQESKITSAIINKANSDKSKTDSSLIQVATDSVQNEKEKNEIVNKQPKTKKGELQWGLTFSAGISGVPNSFLGSFDNGYAANSLYATPSPGISTAVPSEIKSSLALISGILIQKSMSSKIIVSTGLDYKLFSTTNKVGVKNNTTGRYSAINPVNNYHNYSHFLELPLSIKVRINSKGVPLFWDAGISVSRLISSNALQFNNISAVYYKQNALFNKTQAGFSTGLFATFFVGQKASILIGPYIYYGTTKIASDGLYKNQHFTFIGLTSQVFFKR